jgi:FKBP-type peptidyl-prolyl cis-trans isomerase
VISIPSFNILYIFFVVFFVGCTSNLEEEKRVAQEIEIENFLTNNNFKFVKENGVFYAVDSAAYGYEVETGDTISFWYTAKTFHTSSSSRVVFDTNIKTVALQNNLDTTFRNFMPVQVVAGFGNLIEGLKRGLLLARGNEKGIVIFPSEYGFGGNAIGPIPTWTPLMYDIKIISVSSLNIREETLLMQNFLDTTSIPFASDPSGIWFHTFQGGSGTTYPSMGSSVYGWYKVSKLNGASIYETTSTNELLTLSSEKVIMGVAIGFTKLKVGDRAFILVPSPLGYGTTNNNFVNAYCPLMLELRLDSLKL